MRIIYRLLAVLLSAILCVGFIGCADTNGDTDTESSAQTTETSESTSETKKRVDIHDADVSFYWPEDLLPNGLTMKDMLEREFWNIEITFDELTRHGFRFEILDYDDIGFFLLDGYYDLEYHNGTDWEIVSYGRNMEYGFTFPQKPYGYAHDLSLAYCDQNKIKDGRYRYSVIISGRVFAYEFDYTSETTAE